MRLVAVSIVKNEADIIEPFVRHTLACVDEHLVFDHDSTDGTREILLALRAEGLPIRLYTDDSLGNLQQFRSNYLTRIAARDCAAEWIIPLDADEILAGTGDRSDLESELRRFPDTVRTIPLLNYFSTDSDSPAEANPVVRLQYGEHAKSSTVKVLIPRSHALDPTVEAGKGSHFLQRGAVTLPARGLPDEYYLAHLSLRSAQQQVLRVVLAELQKLSRGRAHAGVDVHYRLGFQLLAQNPDLFLSLARPAATALVARPLTYRGGPLRYTTVSSEWSRLARALLPFLEKLATSHGTLNDTLQTSSLDAPQTSPIRELPHANARQAHEVAMGEFPEEGIALSGWGPAEGPVPQAFLPRFHWGYAPATRLTFNSARSGDVWLQAEALTYTENQTVCVEINGEARHRFTFPRVNQKERLQFPLMVREGRNEIALQYDRSLQSAHDPRQLAVIFLSLRLSGVALAS